LIIYFPLCLYSELIKIKNLLSRSVSKVRKFLAELNILYYLVGPGVVSKCLITGSGLFCLEKLRT